MLFHIPRTHIPRTSRSPICYCWLRQDFKVFKNNTLKKFKHGEIMKPAFRYIIDNLVWKLNFDRVLS